MPRYLLAIFLLLFAFSAAATELEPKTIGPTAGNVSFVSTAYAGGKFLTVWRQLFMPSVGIWGAFSDASGKPLGPSFAVVPSTNAQYLNLFPRGDGFVLVWDDANRSSQLCQIDSNGQATGQTTIGPPGLNRAYATADQIVFSRYNGSTIIDFDGRPIRDVPLGFIAAGRNSFLTLTGGTDLMLARYSADGQIVQQWVLKHDYCRTLADCWYAVAARELDSGSILVVLATAARHVQTLILSPDGAVSVPVDIPTSLPAIQRGRIQRSGGHLWLFLEGGGNDGAVRVDATELDDRGAAVSPATTVIGAPPGTSELVELTEGAGIVFAATSPTTADRQVQTFAFRSLAPVTPEVVSTTASIQADAQIASNGDGFLAVWKDTDGTRWSRSHWSAVNAAGQRVGPIFEGDGGVVPKSLVSNGLDYLVLLRSSLEATELIARRFAADGTLLGDTRIPDATIRQGVANSVAAVATSNGYVIVWTGNDGAMHSAVLTSNGVPGPVRTIAPSVPSQPERIRYWVSPALAWDGSAILLTAGFAQDIFSVDLAPPDTILTPYAMLLTNGGDLMDGSETPLDPAFSTPSAAASSGTEFLIAGSEIALGHREGTRLRFTYPLHSGYNAAAVWNGAAYAVARSIRGSATITLVSRDGSIGATTFRAGPEDLDVAADASGRVVLAGVESDGRGPLRAVAYSASELQTLVTERSRAVTH